MSLAARECLCINHDWILHRKLIFCFISCLRNLVLLVPKSYGHFRTILQHRKKQNNKKKLTRFTSRIQARPTSLTPTSTNDRHLPAYTITFNQSITDTFSFFSYPSRVVMVTASSTWNVGHVFWTNDLTMKRTGILRRRRRRREEEWRGGKEEVKRCMYIKAWFLALTYFLFHCLKKECTLLFLVTYNSDTFTQTHAHIF